MANKRVNDRKSNIILAGTRAIAEGSSPNSQRRRRRLGLGVRMGLGTSVLLFFGVIENASFSCFPGLDTTFLSTDSVFYDLFSYAFGSKWRLLVIASVFSPRETATILGVQPAKATRARHNVTRGFADSFSGSRLKG